MQENTIHITQNKTRSAQQANSQRDGKEDRSTGNSYKMPLKFLKNKILQRKMFEKTSWGIYPDIKVTLQNSTNEYNSRERSKQCQGLTRTRTDTHTHVFGKRRWGRGTTRRREEEGGKRTLFKSHNAICWLPCYVSFQRSSRLKLTVTATWGRQRDEASLHPREERLSNKSLSPRMLRQSDSSTGPR